MAYNAPPPPGYPGTYQVPGQPYPSHNKPPTEQMFGTENKRPFLSPGLFATSPMVCLAQPSQGGRHSYSPLKLMSGKLVMECHIATVFFEFEMTVDGSSLPGGPGVVLLPKHYDATITRVTLENLNKDLMYTTILVPKDDTQRYTAKMRREEPFGEIETDADPELFMLPFGLMQAGDSYKVQINWFQPMTFIDGYYKCTLPLEFPTMMMNTNQPIQNVISIECAINTGNEKPVEYKVSSHPMSVLEDKPGRVVLAGNTEKPWSNVDFVVSYKVWGEDIVASMNIQPAGKTGGQDPGGTFALAISPPAPSATTAFQRSIVYVVDRSGSMTGDPIEFARNALLTGLDNLDPSDQFTIIAYDHEQIAWNGALVDASPENIHSAKEWVRMTVLARGLTDILMPLRQAMNILSTSRGVPYVFLLTDGAVENERDIARFLQQAVQSPGPSTVLTPRVSTFAIGPYCNHYFLKQLSTIGRGQFDVAFRPFAIQTQMERMLQAASMPVLTEVSITIADLEDVELYPFPIPDLFVGLPILVSGKYSGTFPPTLQLNGRLPSGEMWIKTLETTRSVHIPLEHVFAKQRLDILTASAWLQENDPRKVQEIVNLSLETAVPCMHTSIVGIETTQSKYEQMGKDQAAGKKIVPAKYAIGGAAAVTVLAGVGLAIGFGDIGATLANAPVLDALAGGLGDILGDVGQGIGDAAEAVGGCCGECFESIGACCGDMFDCLEDVFDAVGECCGI
eukprot:g6186.t1